MENAESQPDWVKTPIANVLHYKPSGTYFARVRANGKLFRQDCRVVFKTGILCSQQDRRPSCGVIGEQKQGFLFGIG